MTAIRLYMKNKFKGLLFLICISVIALSVSCTQESNTSEYADTELLKRVIAVQEQMQKQGNITEKEKQAILSLASLVSSDGMDDPLIDDAISFNDVENGPVYPGCENLPQEGIKECFINNITKFVSAEFNPDIADSLNLSGAQKIVIFFKIDKKGKISNLKVRNTNLVLQAEAVRVIKKLPDMVPASHKGSNVGVMYSLPIIFKIKD